MDRPVNKSSNPPHPEARLVGALAKHLLSPSVHFENESSRRADAAQDGLRCMSGLEKATKLSLPIAEPTQPTENPSAPPSAPKEAPPLYGSEKQEYAPALKKHSVIEALLEFHQRSRNPSAVHAPAAGFRQGHAPEVQAQTKPTSHPRTQSSRPVTRIFRARPST